MVQFGLFWLAVLVSQPAIYFCLFIHFFGSVQVIFTYSKLLFLESKLLEPSTIPSSNGRQRKYMNSLKKGVENLAAKVPEKNKILDSPSLLYKLIYIRADAFYTLKWPNK